jgi:glycerol-3-phosphate dehydrogenase
VLNQLARAYGKDYQRVLGYIDEDPTLKEVLPGNQPVLKAEVVHAVREEMAQKIGDILQRRTELVPIGRSDELLLLECAKIMALELNWDRDHMEQEMNEWKQQKQFSLPVLRECV